MNKRLYRVIFNEALGMPMVVAETAASRGKGAGRAAGSADVRPRMPRHAARLMVRSLVLGLWAALGLAMWPAAGHGQIVADPNAPANQRPTILNAANGVPQIDIQTPSAAGVSRNTYSQFDVQQQGAILNNSRTDAQTQLGGWIRGNPWLAAGTARVILNEVNSSNPSLLHGYVEVAGSRAQVVIANPAGVTCDGCGFINANRATLTTGTPVLNGGNLEGYRVQGGAITVTGAGLDASRTDYAGLIARAVQVNAGIWAKQLKAVAGAGQVEVDGSGELSGATPGAGAGTVPAFAIDVAQLGGMYAGKITLVGTEAGVGVRNAGYIGASAGDVTVTVDGRLENAGRITSTGNTQVDGQAGIDNSGAIHAQGNVSLDTRGDIANSGSIAAQGDATLTANGANSRIAGTRESVFAAGVQADGRIGTGGALALDATQLIAAHGQNLSGDSGRLAARALELSGSQSSAQRWHLQASAGDVDASGAAIVAEDTLTVSAGQTLRTDGARLSAGQISAIAHDLSNIQGKIVQAGAGDLTLSLPGSLDNTQGRIAGNSRNLDIAAATLVNTDGMIEHAGDGRLGLSATMLDGARGQIGSNGLLDIRTASAMLDGAITKARQLAIDSDALSNRGGALVQTGSGTATVTARASFDNTGGTLSSNGSTVLTLGDLVNRGGTIQAAGPDAADLAIDAAGRIDNGAQHGVGGRLAASGNTRITADSLSNAQGQITGGQNLALRAAQDLANVQGLLAAQQDLSLGAGRIDNRHGTIGAVQGQTSVSAGSGALDNTAGRIEAERSVAVDAAGLINADGTIAGSSLALNSQGQGLDNAHGRIGATGASDDGTLQIRSGMLNNDAGLIQARGALGIDTQGQTLINTNSGSGGVLGQGTVTLATGRLDNGAGYIGSAGALTAHGTAIDNTRGGVLGSAARLDVHGTALDNRGGQIQSLGNIDIALGGGTLDNTASLVRSDETMSIAAGSIINADTRGADQGLEGRSLILSARQMDNRNGAMRADDALTLTSDGSIDNAQGLISSAKAATLQDGSPAGRTLTIMNTGGTLIAGQHLAVDGAGLSGDGVVLSQGDLSVRLTRDYIHAGQLQANGNVSLETAGTLTNQSSLLAGAALHLKAATIDNQANGTMQAAQVWLEATDSHTLVNRGLIDGRDTVIQTQTLNNLGSGRIYGDQLAIGSKILTNAAENGAAPVIAARNRLDIGAQTLDNREHALIFSAGDLVVGGSLDACHCATGRADTLNNNSATIEALGSLDVAARQINNTNEHFSTWVDTLPVQNIVEYQGAGSPNRYTPGTPGVYIHNDESDQLMTPEGNYETWLSYNYNRTITETRVQSSDPAQMLSGGAMRISADHLLNDKSRIIAGGALTGNIGSLDNTEVAGESTITDSGSVVSFWRDHKRGRDGTGTSTAAYYPPATVVAISLTPTVYQQNTAPAGTGTRIVALSASSVNQAPASARAADVAIGSGPAISPITQVAALHGNDAGGPAMVVRSGGLDIRVPDNSLFRLNPTPDADYLVETDPRFASYRAWLSSDYMLSALAVDPARTQKRLGDGFYEQKLIREQVAQLTGRRFLDGYASDEAQYRALMEAGVTYARTHDLRPGIALSAEQMAALTSDIVWLVEKDVTLPDGRTTKALVPQLYARVQDGDLQASGALIAGNDVQLQLTGDLGSSGTIAGRQVLALNAENIKNLGGRLLGNDVAVQARTDLDNLGGTIAAGRSLTAAAGRDLNVASTTRTQTNGQGSRTHIDRVAGLYVTGSGGTLLASAGRDVNLLGAALRNDGPPVDGQAAGGTAIVAGNDLNLGTVQEAGSNHIVWDGNNHRSDASRTDVGTIIQARGDIRLQAGNDLSAKAANVTSEQGALLASAGRDAKLLAGEARTQVDEAHRHKSRGFLSTKTISTRDTLDQTSALGTTLSGNTTTVLANQDIKVQGSNVVSTQGTLLAAQHDVSIEAATQSTIEGHFRDEKQSGLLGGSGGVGFSIGVRQQSTDNRATRSEAAAATIGSTQGNVAIQAGQGYRQVGSHVIAPQGDIGIAAQRVDIVEARQAGRSDTETRFRQSGLTVAVTSPVISAIQTAQQMKQAAGQTADARLQVLAGATTALSAKNAYDDVRANPRQLGGVNLNVSIGTSQSRSDTVQTSDSAVGSTVAAGGSIDIRASGAGQASDVAIQGASLQAGSDIRLAADDQIDLLAARNTAEQRSVNQNYSASVGASIGTSGIYATASASGGRGRADGNDVTWSNTHVAAGKQLSIRTGGDATLRGAVASGQQVTADIGGDLRIESLQDTSTYDSKQQSLGGSASFGYGKLSGSVNASQSKIRSNFASVIEQSGIRAGDEGFEVAVLGKTDLIGGAITSTDAAVREGRNRFQAGGALLLQDVRNEASYNAQNTGINVGTGFNPQGKLAPSGTSIGFGHDSGQAGSITQAAVSGLAGQVGARTGDGETGLARLFDADKVQKDINAQMQITQAFGREAPKAVAEFAQSRAKALQAQAKQAEAAGDAGRAEALRTDAQRWEEGGTYRVALHAAAGGLAGGMAGAFGAGAAASAAPLLGQWQQQVQSALTHAGANETVAQLAGQLVAQATATGLGAAVGGGSIAGGAMGFNVDANNRQLHPSEAKWLREQAKIFARKEGISEKRALERLTQQALKKVDYFWRAQLADGDDPAAQVFLASAQQTFTNDLGEQQRFFTAAGQQLFRPEMFADTADSVFYRQFAQSGISRSLRAGLIKELQDSGSALRDGAFDLLRAAKDQPGAVLAGLWQGGQGLLGAVAGNIRESGHALGEGGAVALDPELRAQLNALYGRDVSGYQQVLLGARALSALGGASGAARAGAGVGAAVVKAAGRQVDEVADKLAKDALLKSRGVIDRSGQPVLDLKQLTTEQKGIMGELFGPNTVRRIVPEGQKLARMSAIGETGIDDLYRVNRKDVDYVIIEYKFVGVDSKTGASALSRTADGKQGSESWILGSGRLEKAVGSEKEANKIYDAIIANRTETWVVATRPDGSTEIQVLDALGKPKAIDTSRILSSGRKLLGARP